MRFGFMAAISDIIATCKDLSLVGMLGWQDVRHRYKRSSLGAFWLTLSMAIMIATMAIVFGRIFHSPLREFLPFIAIGMILWGFISSVVTDGCQGFSISHPIIKQLDLPLFVHIARLLWRNIIILGHNIIIFPVVIIAVGQPLTWVMLLSLPGFAILAINLAWIALLAGIICARYRDLAQVVGSILQILFYLTPIMWMPNRLASQKGLYLVKGNPIYHIIETVRAPLLGQMPTAANWMVSLGVAAIGWAITLIIFNRYQRRIAYWL